jgi:hypothetical protein
MVSPPRELVTLINTGKPLNVPGRLLRRVGAVPSGAILGVAVFGGSYLLGK